MFSFASEAIVVDFKTITNVLCFHDEISKFTFQVCGIGKCGSIWKIGMLFHVSIYGSKRYGIDQSEQAKNGGNFDHFNPTRRKAITKAHLLSEFAILVRFLLSQISINVSTSNLTVFSR